MRGGSQSCLLQASNGNFYIVKLLGNPQGSEVLFNEALGTELMQNLGFLVPNWKPIYICAQFIEDNPEIWFETATSKNQRPPAGIHFGSEFLAANYTGAIYEILPRCWFAQVKNRESFVGVLLFDLWSRQTDNRQAIFIRNSDASPLQAIFIDQGGLFGEVRDIRLHELARAIYMDSMVYAGLDIDSVIPIWESRIRNLNLVKICSSIFSMTLDWGWYTPLNFNQTIHALKEGQASLEKYGRLIKSALRTSGDALINAQQKRLDDVQILGSQLRTNSDERITRPMPRVG